MFTGGGHGDGGACNLNTQAFGVERCSVRGVRKMQFFLTHIGPFSRKVMIVTEVGVLMEVVHSLPRIQPKWIALFS